MAIRREKSYYEARKEERDRADAAKSMKELTRKAADAAQATRAVTPVVRAAQVQVTGAAHAWLSPNPPLSGTTLTVASPKVPAGSKLVDKLPDKDWYVDHLRDLSRERMHSEDQSEVLEGQQTLDILDRLTKAERQLERFKAWADSVAITDPNGAKFVRSLLED